MGARWLAGAVAALCLAGCGETAAVQTHGQIRHGKLFLTTTDNNQSFSVKPHKEIVITLPSDASADYYWELNEAKFNVVLPEGTRHDPGGEVWRFWTRGAGTSPIGLWYIRASELDKPARRFRVTIHVR